MNNYTLEEGSTKGVLLVKNTEGNIEGTLSYSRDFSQQVYDALRTHDDLEVLESLTKESKSLVINNTTVTKFYDNESSNLLSFLIKDLQEFASKQSLTSILMVVGQDEVESYNMFSTRKDLLSVKLSVLTLATK